MRHSSKRDNTCCEYFANEVAAGPRDHAPNRVRNTNGQPAFMPWRYQN